MLAVSAALALPAGAAGSNNVYVTNGFGGGTAEVFQFDVGAGGLLTLLSPPTAPTDTGPRTVALTPDGQSAYVVNGSGPVSQYDVGPTGALTPKDPAAVGGLGGNPFEIAVTPDGGHAYVANSGGNVTDPGSISSYAIGAGGGLTPFGILTPAGSGSFGIAVSTDGESLYVANEGSADVSQYDLAPDGTPTPKTPATVAASGGPRGIAVSPDGESVYVANGSGDSVSQYDVGPGGGLTPKASPTVPTGEAPFGIAVSPDGGSVYVANTIGGTGNLGNVSQFDVSSSGALAPMSPATVSAGTNPQWVAVDAASGSAYVVNGGSVAQFDIGAGGALTALSPAEVSAGANPFAAGASPAQPPVASYSVSNASGSPGPGPPGPAVVQTGRFARFDGSASSDPDSAVIRFAWDFGDRQEIVDGNPVELHAYPEPGTYTTFLKLADEGGCGVLETFSFTGQTVACNGGPSAITSVQVIVRDGLSGLSLDLQPQLGPGGLAVGLTCSAAPCSTALSGTIATKRGGGKTKAKSRSTAPATVPLAANASGTATLVLSKKGLKALRSDLKRGRKVVATVTATATDEFDNVEQATARVRLRRGN